MVVIMNDILKGNFKVKKPVTTHDKKERDTNLVKELKKKVLASLGGSMVYIERTDLIWDGDEKEK